MTKQTKTLKNSINECLLVIDFGSQVTQLIARKVRELNVFCEIISHNKLKNYKNEKNVKGIILSGGPLNVYQNKKVKFSRSILSLNIPILGICFGHQIISKELGGKVKRAKSREFGLAKVTKLKKRGLKIHGPLSVDNVFLKNKIEYPMRNKPIIGSIKLSVLFLLLLPL